MSPKHHTTKQRLAAISSPITRSFAFLAAIYHMIATRRVLGRMDDRMLSDIGLSRAQAEHEASRRFWDIKPAPRE